MLLIHLKCCTTITTINFRIFYYPQKKLPSLAFTPTFPRFLHSPTPESEVAQSCLTLCNPMDCSLPGSSVHGIFQARILEWVPGCYFLLQGIFLSQGLNPGLLHCRQTFYHLSYQGSPPTPRQQLCVGKSTFCLSRFAKSELLIKMRSTQYVVLCD